ncbi:uncharacterized protein [Watersipora subatra]|uniref:uncharacterized protein n=1 Tax=Watersipora subatra TaxID=2589382 RepID=UPI00355C592C
MINQTSVLAIFQQLKYFSLKVSLAIVQTLLHYFNGVASHRTKIKRGEETNGLVAEVSRVVARIPGAGITVASDSHFCCWHQNFVSVDYILKSNVYLYFIDCDEAVFVECSETENIYNTRKHPFYFIAQRENAVRTIRVPIVEFLNLAKRIGEPKCKVAWVFHTARCGSTAVAQGMNAIPNCTVISESQDMLVHLSSVLAKPGVVFKDYIESKQFYELLSAAVICVLKNFEEGQLVCLKTTASLNYPLLPLIIKRFPNHKLLSIHRDGAGTVKSFWRMGADHVGLKIGMTLLKWFPSVMMGKLKTVVCIFTNGLTEEVKHFYMEHLNMFVFVYIHWVTNIVTFQRNTGCLAEGQLLPLCYDDIQEDKHSVMLKVLDHLGVDAEHVDVALDAMMSDSQANSPLDLDILKNKKSWVRDEATVEVCNRVLRQFNLPNFDQKFRFNRKFEIELIN